MPISMTGKCLSNKQRGKPTRKRKAINLELKMKIIEKFENGQTLTSLSREFKLASSTVTTIVKDRERIKDHAKGSVPLKSTIITKKRSGALFEMEKLLISWMEDQREKNVPLNLGTIRAKAKSIFEEVKVKFNDPEAKFVASNGWFHRFKARANFQNEKANGEVASEDLKAPKSYPEILRKIIEEGGYTAQKIYNVSETGLFWKKLPKTTFVSEEEKTMPIFKAENDRLMLLFGGNADGSHKLKPYLVYHSENPNALKNISKATLPVYYRSNANAWITTALFEDWFMNCFIPEVEKYCRENCILFKILLIIDNAPAHPPHLDDFHPNVKVVFLPPNSTSNLQPMDQGIAVKFKAYYLRRIFMQATEEIDNGKTLCEFWKYYNIYKAILNIAKAWEEVSKVCMNSMWKKLCPQFVNSFKSSNRDESYKDVTNNIMNLAEQLELELNIADIEELLDAHKDKLTNEELMELDNTKFKEQDQTEAEDEPVEEPRRFNTEEMMIAFREISSAMARFEKMDPNSSRFLKVQKGIDETLACYKEIYEEKKKATVQSSLDKFIQPKPSMSRASSSITNIVLDVNPDDVIPFSFPSLH